MEQIAHLGYVAPVIVIMAIYAGLATTISFSRKMKIAVFALAILIVFVCTTHNLNDDIVRNVLVFFLVLYFLPYTFATWISNFKNRFQNKNKN